MIGIIRKFAGLAFSKDKCIDSMLFISIIVFFSSPGIEMVLFTPWYGIIIFHIKVDAEIFSDLKSNPISRMRTFTMSKSKLPL